MMMMMMMMMIKNMDILLFLTSDILYIIELLVVSDTLPPEVKRQVDLIESMIKSRVAIGSQISRSRVMNTLRNNVGNELR